MYGDLTGNGSVHEVPDLRVSPAIKPDMLSHGRIPWLRQVGAKKTCIIPSGEIQSVYMASKKGVKSSQEGFPLKMITIPSDKILHARFKGSFNNPIFLHGLIGHGLMMVSKGRRS